MNKQQVPTYFQSLQDQITEKIKSWEGESAFEEDEWKRDQGGGGRTRVIQEGEIIEKGGVNFSEVYGEPSDRLQEHLEVEAEEFYATGISLILHPQNPWIPIIHMNLRYFSLSNGQQWFGGGIDLTPHYIDQEEARFFHQKLREVCNDHHPDYYTEFKQWADDYFYLPHREETRGVGGIFFDYLSPDDQFSVDERFAFVKAVGESFLPIYTPMVESNKDKDYGEREREWQLVRRGRYVEFNLVYDRGTRFGLDSGGRIESILVSLPPIVRWPYNFQPQKGSREQKTLQQLKKGIDWAQ